MRRSMSRLLAVVLAMLVFGSAAAVFAQEVTPASASPAPAASAVPTRATPTPTGVKLEVIDDLFAKPGFVGLLMRPFFCLDGCDGNAFTFGAEAGYKFIAFAVRYGYKDSTHFLIPDFRGYYDFQVVRNLTISPMLEFSPMFMFGDAAKGFNMIIRPGVRVSYAPLPYMMIFIEPFLLDIGVFSKTWVDGGGSATSSDVVTRYNLGFGIQTRF